MRLLISVLTGILLQVSARGLFDANQVEGLIVYLLGFIAVFILLEKHFETK